MSSAKESTTVHLKMSSDWYNLSTDILKPSMVERSRTLSLIRQNNFDVKQLKVWRVLLKNLKDSVKLAKSKWSNYLAKIVHVMSNFQKMLGVLLIS